MNIEEQIERAFHEWWNAPEPAGGRTVDISEYIMPLVKRAQAKAWTEGAQWAAVECGVIPSEQAAWVTPGDNPYIEKRA